MDATPPVGNIDERGRPDSPDELMALWQDAVARPRLLAAEAMNQRGRDQPAVWIDDWHEQPPSLRWIMHHMIEEYARHNGHADLLRESVDGLTGE